MGTEWMLFPTRSLGRLRIDGEVSVGRDAACTLALEDPHVSRVHCRFVLDRDGVVLRDESTNGTFVNGVHVHGATRLRAGDVVEVGAEELVVAVARRGSGAAPPPPRGPDGALLRAIETSPPASGTLPATRRAARHPALSRARSVAPRLEVVPRVVRAGDPAFHDALRVSQGPVLLVVGDMTSGGEDPAVRSSALASLRLLLRHVARTDAAPEAVLAAFNATLSATGLHASAICARLDVDAGRFAYACAGERRLWIARLDGRTVELSPTPSVDLGRIAAARFPVAVTQLDPGDVAAIPSDAWARRMGDALAGATTAEVSEAGASRDASTLREALATGADASIDGVVLCLSLDANA